MLASNLLLNSSDIFNTVNEVISGMRMQLV